MLSKRFYKFFGIRVKLMEMGFATYYFWDKEKEHLKPASHFYILTMWMSFAGAGVPFVGLHILHMYMKTHRNEIAEEGTTGPTDLTLMEFATLMIEGGEILLATCMSFLNLVFLRRLEVFRYLFNELLDYNKKLSKMIEEGKLELTDDQKNVVRFAEFLCYVIMLVGTLLPFGVAASVTVEFEPTHKLLYEWLEVRFGVSLGWSPFIALLMMTGYSCGTTIGMMTKLICLYYMTATICTEAFTPDAMEWTPNLGRNRCKLVTNGFGTITDEEVIYLYRTQQVLNGLLNCCFKSWMIAFHHVGVLATAVVLLVFMVKYQTIMNEQGIMAYVVVITSMTTPLILIYFQSKMAGAVIDISEDFQSSAERLVPRRFEFRRFCKGCTTFYIQVAYPFYTVNSDTFTEFCQQVQDYSMELLLW